MQTSEGQGMRGFPGRTQTAYCRWGQEVTWMGFMEEGAPVSQVHRRPLVHCTGHTRVL